jgi:hypothetical protein
MSTASCIRCQEWQLIRLQEADGMLRPATFKSPGRTGTASAGSQADPLSMIRTLLSTSFNLGMSLQTLMALLGHDTPRRRPCATRR